jgi:hypothetical protein
MMSRHQLEERLIVKLLLVEGRLANAARRLAIVIKAASSQSAALDHSTPPRPTFKWLIFFCGVYARARALAATMSAYAAARCAYRSGRRVLASAHGRGVFIWMNVKAGGWLSIAPSLVRAVVVAEGGGSAIWFGRGTRPFERRT